MSSRAISLSAAAVKEYSRSVRQQMCHGFYYGISGYERNPSLSEDLHRKLCKITLLLMPAPQDLYPAGCQAHAQISAQKRESMPAEARLGSRPLRSRGQARRGPLARRARTYAQQLYCAPFPSASPPENWNVSDPFRSSLFDSVMNHHCPGACRLGRCNG